MDEDSLLQLSKSDFMRVKIVAAIKDLARESSIDKVTVTKVCERAGISRSSFYHLFDGINQALAWDIEQSLVRSLRESSDAGGWEDVLAGQTTVQLNHLKDDPDFYVKLHREMSHVDYSSVYLATRRLRVEWFKSIIGPCSEDLLFEIDFFVYGESNSVAAWAAGGMKEAPEKVARRIVACVPRGMKEALDQATGR